MAQVEGERIDNLARCDRLGRFPDDVDNPVERLQEVLDGEIDPSFDPVLARSRGFVPDFVRIARAVRQIMVLQHEIAGLRAARRRKPGDKGRDRSPGPRGRKRVDLSFGRPLPDDTEDFFDYRPVGEAVGWIRETLGVEAPADDPFRDPRSSAAPPEPEREPPPETEGEPDRPEADASEPEAAAEAPAATERRASGRAYDLDFRDSAGEDLRIAPGGGDPTARGPP